jgi:hypothetical protein
VFSITVEKRFPSDTLSAYLRNICTTVGWKRADRSFTCFEKYIFYSVMSFYCGNHKARYLPKDTVFTQHMQQQGGEELIGASLASRNIPSTG